MTPECAAADGFKEYLLNLSDGGQNTTRYANLSTPLSSPMLTPRGRTRIFDTLRGTGFWPQQYNGRGAMNGTLRDDESGMAESENRELYEKALASGDWERLTMFWYVSSCAHVCVCMVWLWC